MGYYEEDSFIMDQNFIKDRIGQLSLLTPGNQRNKSVWISDILSDIFSP